MSHPIKVFYDNLVIARAYIGPLGGEAPTSAAPFGRGPREATAGIAAWKHEGRVVRIVAPGRFETSFTRKGDTRIMVPAR